MEILKIRNRERQTIEIEEAPLHPNQKLPHPFRISRILVRIAHWIQFQVNGSPVVLDQIFCPNGMGMPAKPDALVFQPVQIF